MGAKAKIEALEKTSFLKSLRYINQSELEVREYQEEIARKCVKNNSLVVIPTGLGKTIIAALVSAYVLEKHPNCKIILMAPTRPLISQHYDSFQKALTVLENKYTMLTGKVLSSNRADLFSQNTMLFYTPQTLENDLDEQRYDLKDVQLIIFDEAHHATGDYAYTNIAKHYREQNPNGLSLGLTASPGASKFKIKQLCKALYISPESVYSKTRMDQNVRKYIQSLDVYKVGVNLTPEMRASKKIIEEILEECLQFLSQGGHLNKHGPLIRHKLSRKSLIDLQNELSAKLKESGDKTGLYSAISVNSQGLILYHMLELIHQQGLDVLLTYLEKLVKESKKQNSSKANRVLASNFLIKSLLFKLRSLAEQESTRLIHPKFDILKRVLFKQLKNSPNSRILVFVKLRDSVKNIVEKLKKIDNFHPVRFVGQATKSNNDKGLSQKLQIEILNQFKEGVYNILVSTNVGEEGLDIAECDLVVFYDVVASEIRVIQRKGRTGRHKSGEVIILYTRETNDEIYLNIALRKLKTMANNLTSFTSVNTQSQIPKLHIKECDCDIAHELTTRSALTDQSTSEPTSLFGNNSEGKSKMKAHICNIPKKFQIKELMQDLGATTIDVNSGPHLAFENLVGIHFVVPAKYSKKELMHLYDLNKDKFMLFLIIFDCSDASIEAQNANQACLDFAKINEIKHINVKDEEEVVFIVENIYLNARTKLQAKKIGEV